MDYKTILAHVDHSKQCPARLDLAFRIAREFDAHLVGLHALTVTPLPSYAVAEAGAKMEEVRKAATERLRAEGKATFEAAARRADANQAEWRASSEDAVQAVALHARYADLAVIGQSEPGSDTGVVASFPAHLVLYVGRPLLVVPYAGRFESVGKRVLVAWNAGHEATRAVTDALPFLRRANRVHVISFNPAKRVHGDVPGADIGLYLARHGVKIEVAQQTAKDVDVGNQLLSRAADLEVDLIVMGAYGHSRMQELIMGGVTRTVLESMTVPVLMSH